MTIVSAVGLIFLLPVFTEATFRIVGGRFENITNVPYQIGLENTAAKEWCGGVILSQRILVTAGHCLKKVTSVNQLKITVGTNRFTWSKIYKIQNYTVHPEYNATHLNYDVAILQLNRDLTYSESIQAAVLPEADDDVAEDTEGVASGWGYTNPFTPSASSLLKSAKLKVLSQTRCESIIKKNSQFRMVNGSIFCAGTSNFRDSVCFADSGGPFVTDNDQLRGLVSYGWSCGRNRLPAVFSKVAFFLDFINEFL